MVRVALVLLLMLPSARSQAQTPVCDALPRDAKAKAASILAEARGYDCCSDAVAVCLKKAPVCSVAVRLANEVCRRVAAGADRAVILKAVESRATRLAASATTIDLEGLTPAGDPQAPIAVVEYACGRCPYCAKVTARMHEAVTSGRLKGKARLYFKVFPLRSHEGSKEAGLAFVAASALGRFWDYALLAYERFDSFEPAKLSAWAGDVGLDRAAFDRQLADPSAVSLLVANKKEGLKNGVDGTPTFFIDGRRHTGKMDLDEIMDIIEERWDLHRAAP